MADPVDFNIAYFVWKDAKGRTSKTTIPMNPAFINAKDHPYLNQIRDQLRALSDAKMIRHGLRRAVAVDGDAAESNAYGADDDVEMHFRGAGQEIVKAVVSGVKSTLLTAGESLITATSGPGKDLKDFFLEKLTDTGGNIVLGYLGSKRVKAKRNVPLLN